MTSESAAESETVRVWLVERTYSDDELNIILEYATPDGRQYLRKERALTSFGDRRGRLIHADPSCDRSNRRYSGANPTPTTTGAANATQKRPVTASTA